MAGVPPQHGVAGQPEVENDHVGTTGERACFAASPSTDLARGCGPGQPTTCRPASRSHADTAWGGSRSSVTTRMVGLRGATYRLRPARSSHCGCPQDLRTWPDASRREGPPALQDRAGLGEPEKCQHATLAGEARSDDQSDHLRRQAPRTSVQDRQRMASAPAPTPAKEGHPAAHRSRLPEGLDGSGTGPVAVEIHQ
jgi:hypothetical protein